ncbi:MAG: hypothetical protein PVJ92_03170, partial [Candidatus Dependentiae bacterium]
LASSFWDFLGPWRLTLHDSFFYPHSDMLVVHFTIELAGELIERAAEFPEEVMAAVQKVQTVITEQFPA